MRDKVLNVGDIAPDFETESLEGKIKLSDFLGKNIILYFYPKDDTPGCTTEARAFSAKIDEISRLNAVVLGVSKDNLECHSNFRTKYDLKINLVVDNTGDICSKYGVWVQKSFLGKKYMGIQRATFLIDAQGKIVHIWPKVSVVGHANEVVQKLSST